MVEFKKFVDAYAEVYGIEHLDVKTKVNKAVSHLTDVLTNVEDFSKTCIYLKDFMDHYDGMKLYHLEAEIKMNMARGDSFFEACREWDI